MISINLGFYGDGLDAPRAEVLALDDVTRFIVLRPCADVSLSLNGRDETSVTHARVLAACLVKAADELEAALAERPSVAAEGPTLTPILPTIEDEVIF